MSCLHLSAYHFWAACMQCKVAATLSHNYTQPVTNYDAASTCYMPSKQSTGKQIECPYEMYAGDI